MNGCRIKIRLLPAMVGAVLIAGCAAYPPGGYEAGYDRPPADRPRAYGPAPYQPQPPAAYRYYESPFPDDPYVRRPYR